MNYSDQTKSYLIEAEPYCLSPLELVQQKIKLLNLVESDVLCDFGCGNAIQLIEACSLTKVSKCIGYELLPQAIQDAKINIEKSGYQKRIDLKELDFFKANISNVTAVILFLTRTMLGALSLKLEKELPIGARIVTHQFDLPGWKSEKKIAVNLANGTQENLYLYIKK